MALASLGVIAPVPAAALACPGEPRARCLAFEPARLIPNATLSRLEYVAGGATLQLVDVDASCNRPSQLVEANICRIALDIPTSGRSSITFELWLPDEWPGARLVSTGNGGLDGCGRPCPQGRGRG